MAGLLDSLLWAGAQEQAAALLHRDPAAHVALDDPLGVASLLDRLREAGAQEIVCGQLFRAEHPVSARQNCKALGVRPYVTLMLVPNTVRR